MKILVTGGAGFIGSYVVDILIKQNHEILIIDDLSGGNRENINPNAKFIHKNLIDVNKRLLEDVEIIYHLAAFPAEGLSTFMPFYTSQNNYMAFLKLLVAAINSDVKTIVFTSSMAVYGNNLKVPFQETFPRNPVDPYGIAKAMCEQVLENYSREFGFNYVILRPHNVYGIRQNLCDPYRNVIGIWINRILNGKQPIIYGDGKQTRAFTYIDDITSCIVNSGTNKNCFGENINLGSKRPYSIIEACEIVIKAFGINIKPIFNPARPLEVKHAYCSIEKSQKLLGFEEKTPLKEGINKMVSWAKAQPLPKFKYFKDSDYEITKKFPKTWKDKQL
ncbi:MAG: NAD-dependent epimerase/dehydratase family protein [Promethearchaeota archaeon]